ncbi:MAG: DUF362 domain-containing protein [bacterium]
MAGLRRRDFLKLSGAAGGVLLMGTYEEMAKGSMQADVSPDKEKVPVTLVRCEDRRTGVASSIKALGINPAKNKHVLIKPNFNTADPAPGSTHNDTLAALVEEVWKMGAKGVSLGERSYPPTRRVMEEKGILPLMKKLDVRVIDFDELEERDWVKVKPKDSHWEGGFRIARPVLDAECLVSTCCLKTHQFGGVFTMSLKLHVGVVPTRRHGYDYMTQLHSSPHQRKMIAEINAPFTPDLIVMDGIEAFVDGGPMDGRRAQGNVFLASADRVAIDAVGLAVLKLLGSNDQIMKRKIFEQEQIARAVDIGLGASSPSAIDVVPANDESRAYRERVVKVLNEG